MSSYEATVRVTHISTSSKARNGLSVSAAVGAAKAHLNYITRDDAAEAGNVLAWSNGEALEGSTDELKAAARDAIDQRAEKHNDAYGVRLADKMIVSLPNDATIPEQRKMCGAILSTLCGTSAAFGIAAIHTDKDGNNHAHLEFIDNLETREAALARRPDAKRVRRADHLRLNEGGNRQALRATVADCINQVSAENGRRLAEVRSYKDRGIDRQPQQHEGPQVSNKLDRHPDRPAAITSRVFSRLKANAIALRKRLEGEAQEGASILPNEIPKRHGKGWLGGAWSSWLRRTNQARTTGQDQTTQEAIYNGVSDFVADWTQQTPEAAHGPQERPQKATPAILRPEVREQVKEAATQAIQPPALPKPKRKRRQDER